MNKPKTKEYFLLTALLAGIGIYFIFIFTVNIFHFNYQMNSDIASDVILADLIRESGEVIPSTWYIAAETRIICTPNIAALLGYFVNNMTLASGLACCTMTILIALSVFYFGKSAGLSNTLSAMLSFLCVALPCGFAILELLYLFVSYYAIHAVIFFITLAIYAQSMNASNIKWGKLLIGILPAFVLGLQGVRGILLIYGPLFGIEILRSLYIFYQKQKWEKKDILLSLWTFLLLLSSFLGTCFPTSIGQPLSRNIRKGAQKLFTIVVPDMGEAAGFMDSGPFGKLCLTILLSASLYVLFCILLRMRQRKSIAPIEWAWLTVCASPMVTAVLVAFTTVESTPRYYFILPFLMAFSVVLLCKWSHEKQEEPPPLKWLVPIAFSAAAVFAALNIFQLYLPVVRAEEPPNSDAYRVTEFLDKSGYQTAYASFESANKMTVLSNGKVRVYPVASVEKMDVCKWMTSTNWYCPNMPFEQKTAYIATESEIDAINNFLAGKEASVQKSEKIGKYYIYVSDYNYSNLGE
ncbi:MAG: hypothetical protein NC400_09770 [Clostridium sp.]|nr:hypothetical protein [Clostridium sp.]